MSYLLFALCISLMMGKSRIWDSTIFHRVRVLGNVCDLIAITVLNIEESRKLTLIDHLLFWGWKRLLGGRCNYFHLREEENETQSNDLPYAAQSIIKWSSWSSNPGLLIPKSMYFACDDEFRWNLRTIGFCLDHLLLDPFSFTLGLYINPQPNLNLIVCFFLMKMYVSFLLLLLVSAL